MIVIINFVRKRSVELFNNITNFFVEVKLQSFFIKKDFNFIFLIYNVVRCLEDT